jgi:hypothetical protein
MTDADIIAAAELIFSVVPQQQSGIRDADARLLHLARIGAAVVAADDVRTTHEKYNKKMLAKLQRDTAALASLAAKDETRTSFVKFDKKALDRLQQDLASLAGE